MKKLLSLMLALVMLFSVCTAAFAAEASYDTESLNAETIPYGSVAYNYVKYLDQNLRERIAGTEQERKTAAFIQGELESFGYDVTIQDFNYKRGSTTTYSQNLIVTKPGRSDKQIILGAHYDSVGTAGVDDNGSGTSVALETAMRMYGVDTPYTIVFIFFGAEETGLRGSGAYAKAMTQEEIDNTICMINIDSVLAGTYRYLYSGTAVKDADGNTVVELDWPFYQAMEISENLGLDMHSNDTPLNFDYPAPTTGSWSDHQSFRNLGIPYIYCEAANWELPDNPKRPQNGSTGAYETESGEVMHVKGRDDLTFIENEWGDRAKNTLTAYSTLMPEVLKRLDPAGLLADKAELEKAILDAEAIDAEMYSDESAAALNAALENANEVLVDDTLTTEDQETVDNAVVALNEAVDALESVTLVVSTEKVDSAEADTVEVDITYTGDVAITSVRFTLDSELKIANIVEANGYKMETNNNEYVIIYAEDGSEIDGVLCTLVYNLNVTPWYANDEYAIDIEIEDATAMDAEYIRLGAVDGAVVVDNTYSVGDANLDGLVTNADVTDIAKHLIKLITLEGEALLAADVDIDGEVDNSDLVKLARIVVEK